MDANLQEKTLRPASGIAVLILNIMLLILSIPIFVFGVILLDEGNMVGLLPLLGGIALWVVCPILFCGLKTVQPNEARVLTLFGKYHGTIKEPGYYFVNPFCASFSPAYNAAKAEAAAQSAKAEKGTQLNITLGGGGMDTRRTVSLKTRTLDNGRQKVNDVLGNPVIIGAVVIWRVADPTRAVFAVENYADFLSIQTDSTIRNTARLYPYDLFDEDEDGDGVQEKTLRGSAIEIADSMRAELQKRVETAGLVIEEVRITHLAYAEEIAAAMLQRQQAVAIIAARQKIVDGAVGMVKMAIDKLGEDSIVVLDEERKAAMVSNLLVVLCGNKDAQPVVNSGSLY